LQQFQRCRALPGNDVEMIVGRDRNVAAVHQLRQPGFPCIVGQRAEVNDSAEVFDRFDFDRGRIFRHDDMRRAAVEPGREGQCSAMVA